MASVCPNEVARPRKITPARAEAPRFSTNSLSQSSWDLCDGDEMENNGFADDGSV